MATTLLDHDKAPIRPRPRPAPPRRGRALAASASTPSAELCRLGIVAPPPVAFATQASPPSSCLRWRGPPAHRPGTRACSVLGVRSTGSSRRWCAAASSRAALSGDGALRRAGDVGVRRLRMGQRPRLCRLGTARLLGTGTDVSARSLARSARARPARRRPGERRLGVAPDHGRSRPARVPPFLGRAMGLMGNPVQLGALCAAAIWLAAMDDHAGRWFQRYRTRLLGGAARALRQPYRARGGVSSDPLRSLRSEPDGDVVPCWRPRSWWDPPVVPSRHGRLVAHRVTGATSSRARTAARTWTQRGDWHRRPPGHRVRTRAVLCRRHPPFERHDRPVHRWRHPVRRRAQLRRRIRDDDGAPRPRVPRRIPDRGGASGPRPAARICDRRRRSRCS